MSDDNEDGYVIIHTESREKKPIKHRKLGAGFFKWMTHADKDKTAEEKRLTA